MTENIILWVAAENSDLTEGRGPMRTIGIYTDQDKAIAKIKGRGVMGVGDGEVYRVELTDGQFEGFLLSRENLYYGYRQLNGRWGYGFTALAGHADDPEYAEYVRLKDKFDK